MILDRWRTVPWRGLPFWLTGNRLRILMYHCIADNPRDPHAVSPEHFGEQMAALAARSYRVISLAEGLRRLQQHLLLRGYVALTFDDAYRDFLTHALPVLEQFGYPATLFVPTGLLGGTAVWDSYDKSKPLMTWDELTEAHRRGVSVASHTVTHPRLTECDDRKLEYEVRASLDMLRSRLSKTVPALSYPGGYFGPREMKAAQDAGYIAAVGPISRWDNDPTTNRFALRRRNPKTIIDKFDKCIFNCPQPELTQPATVVPLS